MAQLEIELRYQDQSELFELFRQCQTLRHVWRELETDLVDPGRQAHYCTRCLRVAIGDGAEFWPTLTNRAKDGDEAG